MANEEICARCNQEKPDLRTLWMACFYEMDELDVPFKQKRISEWQQFYTLKVCKECRAEWMVAIESWFKTVTLKESPGSGIFTRRNGATVEIPEEEWRSEFLRCKPFRVTEGDEKNGRN